MWVAASSRLWTGYPEGSVARVQELPRGAGKPLRPIPGRDDLPADQGHAEERSAFGILDQERISGSCLKGSSMINALMIRCGSRVKDALKQLEETERKILIRHRRREPLSRNADRRGHPTFDPGSEGSLDGTVEKICNTNPCVAYGDYDVEQVKQEMLEKNIGSIPVVNASREVVDVSVLGEHFRRKPGPQAGEARLNCRSSSWPAGKARGSTPLRGFCRSR